MKRLIQIFEDVLGFAKRLSYFAILLVGALLILISVWVATSSGDKATAILITAVGSIVGTGVISLVWPRVAADWRDLESLNQQKLRAKLTEAEKEVSRLMQTRVNVNSFKAVMKLGVLETDSVIRDICQTVIFQEDGGRMGRTQIDDFVGVVTATFKARLGVDLEELRFWEAGSNALMVSGMRSEFQGFLNMKKRWDLAEIRIRKSGGLLPNDYQIAEGDPRLIKHRDVQEAAFDERINNGMEFGHLDGLIRRWAEEIVRAMLSPLGREILFVDTPTPDSIGLVEYLHAHNERIDGKIQEIRRLQSGTDTNSPG